MSESPLNEYIPESGVTMFTTSWCGYCRNLKRMMETEGIAYREVNIEETPGTPEIVESFNDGNQTVPTLVFPDGSAATNPRIDEVRARLQD